jgi:hypothetical protein
MGQTNGVPPSSSTLLTDKSWRDGSISAGGAIVWYRFTASSDTTYYVTWDDSYDGTKNGTKTCDIKVTAYTSSGNELFKEIDSAYTIAQSISGINETVYLKVEGYGNTSTGTYAIMYYSDTPSRLTITNIPQSLYRIYDVYICSSSNTSSPSSNYEARSSSYTSVTIDSSTEIVSLYTSAGSPWIGTDNYYYYVYLVDYSSGQIVASGQVTFSNGNGTIDASSLTLAQTASSGISDITYSAVSGSDGDAWTLESDGRRKSPEINDNSITKCRINFYSSGGSSAIVIQLDVSSEDNYDFAFISELDNTSADYNSGHHACISGTTSETVTIPVSTVGNHFVDIGYQKDVLANGGSDCAWFKVIE